MNNKIQILNINVLSISMDSLITELDEGVLFTLNVDHLVKLQKDRPFYNAYAAATHVVVDSQILFLLMSLTEHTPVEKISGSDLLPAYYYYHRNNKNIKIFLLGSRNGIAQKAMDRINEKVGRNIVVAAHSPSLGFDTKEEECRDIIQRIKKSEANVLIVGVGPSKQEQWIIKYKNALPEIRLFMALGAAIDIEAGVVKRAPRWVSTMALEWAYRLYQEPKRLWRRYLVEDMAFFWLILKYKTGLYKNPWR